MIFFNNIELDYYPDTLKNISINRQLFDIESLADRKGTKSTTFDVPRTSHNAKTLGFIDIDGSISQPIGDGIIKIDNNIYSQGRIFVKGYNDNTFQLQFFGQDTSFIEDISKKYMWQLMGRDRSVTFNDTNIRIGLESVLTSDSIQFIYSKPNLDGLNAFSVAPYFTMRSLIRALFAANGIPFIVSEFLDSDLGQNIVYSKNDEPKRSSNFWYNSANIFNIDHVDLGTSYANNNSITEISYAGGKAYELQNDCTNIKIRGTFDYSGDLPEYDFTQLTLWILRPQPVSPSNPLGLPTFLYYSLADETNNFLVKGKNYIDVTIEETFLAGDYMYFNVDCKNNGAPLTPTLVCDEISISHDNIQTSDLLWFGDFFEGTQLEFLKGFLNDFNLVIDINGDTATIELNDKGIEYFSNNPLPSLTNGDFVDISNLIENKIDVSFDYVQASIIHMKQKTISNGVTDNKQLLPFQELGSIPIFINSFNKTVQVFDSSFSVLIDYLDLYIYGVFGGVFTDLTEWGAALSVMCDQNNYRVQQSATTYTNIDATTTSVEPIITSSKPIRFSLTSKYLFAETLRMKRNNKIVEVNLYDRLGTLMTFRKDYKIDNQIYKLIGFDFNPSTKECIAQLILK